MEYCWSDAAKRSNRTGRHTSWINVEQRFHVGEMLDEINEIPRAFGNLACCLVQTSSSSIRVIIGVGRWGYPISEHNGSQQGEPFTCGRGTADSRSMARRRRSHP